MDPRRKGAREGRPSRARIIFVDRRRRRRGRESRGAVGEKIRTARGPGTQVTGFLPLCRVHPVINRVYQTPIPGSQRAAQSSLGRGGRTSRRGRWIGVGCVVRGALLLQG